MKSIPRISDAEWEVMKVIWRQAPCSAQTIIDALSGSKNWHAQTIKTLLTRLGRKGAIRFKKEGRAYVYSPSVSEAECRATAAAAFLDRVFDGALSPCVAHFVTGQIRLLPEEIAELERILKDSNKRS
jgi:BlaI family transcriptional regulator, penicillinase repressor